MNIRITHTYNSISPFIIKHVTMNLQRNVSNNGWEKCSDTTRRRLNICVILKVTL